MITIGECLPPNRPPLKPPLVGRDFAVYVHVNYGGEAAESPDELMSALATEHGLTQVKKFLEIHKIGEMSRVVSDVLRRLGILQ